MVMRMVVVMGMIGMMGMMGMMGMAMLVTTTTTTLPHVLCLCNLRSKQSISAQASLACRARPRAFDLVVALRPALSDVNPACLARQTE
eukprot:151815-Rhodomonas_salina.1